MLRIDLNSDLGESFGSYKIGKDEDILEYVSSANIACGFHAGDPLVMEKTVREAINKGVAIGAHPGFPDIQGFGRRRMDMSYEELRACIIYQLGALKGFLDVHGEKIQHVKPHGAMYNMAAKDYEMAKVIAEAVKDVDKDIIFMGLAGSNMIKAAEDVGLKTAGEFFADRAYNYDGTLVSRREEGAVIHSTEICVERVLRAIKEGVVRSIEGEDIPVKMETICVHGDNESALEFVRNLRGELIKSGVDIISLRD